MVLGTDVRALWSISVEIPSPRLRSVSSGGWASSILNLFRVTAIRRCAVIVRGWSFRFSIYLRRILLPSASVSMSVRMTFLVRFEFRCFPCLRVIPFVWNIGIVFFLHAAFLRFQAFAASPFSAASGCTPFLFLLDGSGVPISGRTAFQSESFRACRR